jgi:carbamate kinase
VIDKDRASNLLASDLRADLLLISTAVERVAINFNKPNQQWLDKMTLSEAKRLYAEGHFLSGSMGPTIEAIIAFLEAHPHGQPGSYHGSSAHRRRARWEDRHVDCAQLN